jgi:transposase
MWESLDIRGRTNGSRNGSFEVNNEGESISALAEIYGVARKTIYNWLDRHDVEGAAGLADRSRVPQHSSFKLSDEIVAARQRSKWGLESCG